MTRFTPTLDLQDSYRPLAVSDISVFEASVGATLPLDYRKFLLANNGPTLPHLPVTFQPSNDDESELPHGESIRFFLGLRTGEAYCDIAIQKEVFGESVYIPVARTSSNYVWISLKSGQLTYYDGQDNEWTWVTETFTTFVAGLMVTPEDICRVREQSIPALQAAEIGDIKSFTELDGLKGDLRDQHGRTALMICANVRQKSMTKWLISRGVPLDARDNVGHTALFSAVAGEAFDITKLLVEAGADPRAADNKGVTPLEFAREMQKTRIADWLETK